MLGRMSTTSPSPAAHRRLVNESAIYGVVLVAGLVVIIGTKVEGSWAVLVKVLATLGVFWASHVYAGIIANLSEPHLAPGEDLESRDPHRLGVAIRRSLDHSWGMLLAGVIPLVVLSLGVLKLLSDNHAIWGTLWTSVAVLAVLGWVGVTAWTKRPSRGLVGALVTSLLGLALVALKALVH